MKCGAWLPAAEAHAAIPQASLRKEPAALCIHRERGQQHSWGITAEAISDPGNELGFLGRVDTRLAWGSIRIAKPDSTEMSFLVVCFETGLDIRGMDSLGARLNNKIQIQAGAADLCASTGSYVTTRKMFSLIFLLVKLPVS